jgi:F-type H+-transporting ATPase subunit b
VELSWTTFILEIINFLVLVWILKRFLYKPVLNAIAKRKAAIDEILTDAKTRQADAQRLEQQYSNRMAEWEREKQKLRAAVVEEVNAQRVQLMAAVEESLDEERQKARVLEERRLDELRKTAEQEGILDGVKFTARLLQRCASEELETKLVRLVLEDLPNLTKERLDAIRAASLQPGWHIKTTSAFPLSEPQRNAIAQGLKEVTQDKHSVEFHEDRSLLAGLRISLGPWIVRANLEDELAFFSEAVSHGNRNQ